MALTLFASGTAHATFSPVLNAAVADPTAEATSDITIQFGLPSGDVNFATAVRFLPAEWGIVDGRDIPVGAAVGSTQSDATLGLINSACNQSLPVNFDMYNASVDPTDTVSFNDLNGNFTQDFAEDSDGNGLIDGVDRWPDFIFRVIDTPATEPISRSAGMTIVAGTPVLLQFITFPPGTLIYEDIPNDPALGYPTVLLLQDVGDPLISPRPQLITDFCTPLSVTLTFFGETKDNTGTFGVDEGGIPVLVNPQDGSYTFTFVNSGRRDADGDGYENALDTCPLDPNVGNPRITLDGDLDGDGLDAACDPNDDPTASGTNIDEDSDGYPNRLDNCPLIPNGEFQSNQADADADFIGDVCDPNPNNADTEGALIFDESSVEVTIGAGAGPGGPPRCPNPGCWAPPLPPDAKGNLDCDDDIDVDDVLAELQHVGGSPFAQELGCPAIGSAGRAQTAGATSGVYGDIDCDDDVDGVDVLLILRFVAGVPADLPPDCMLLGTTAEA